MDPDSQKSHSNNEQWVWALIHLGIFLIKKVCCTVENCDTRICVKDKSTNQMANHLTRHHDMTSPEKKPRMHEAEEMDDSVSISKVEQEIIDSHLYIFRVVSMGLFFIS